MTKAMMADVKTRKAIKPGDWYHDDFTDVYVMAVVDDWLMARRPRGVPFVLSVKNLHDGTARVSYGKSALVPGKR